MRRFYEGVIADHLAQYEQMVFISGPRQSGKTTVTQNLAESYGISSYYNWDNVEHRELLLSGYERLLQNSGMPILGQKKRQHVPLIIFDEIHKYKTWKSYLKGFFDTYKTRMRSVVTGSAKLNIYKRGGDSLMGRYFLYRLHPLSLREAIGGKRGQAMVAPPKKPEKELMELLLEFGGFPEPFLKQSKTFYNRWQNLRGEQLVREDLQAVARVAEIHQFELLARLVAASAAQLVSYESLARKIRISEPTVRRWLGSLEILYHCFFLTPWTSNIERSLLKMPKLYSMDWSLVADKGARYENFVAAHLLKAVDYWNDSGQGKFALHFIRDKEGREVDFVVIKDRRVWFLVEVKASHKEPLSKHLFYFQQKTKAEHAFQLVFDLPFVAEDCFSETSPVIVPVSTFLSQLV